MLRMRAVPVVLACLIAAHGGTLAAGDAAGQKQAALRVVHLTDFHCASATANPRPRFLFDVGTKDLVASFELLEAAVRDINESVKPALVVITGDLTDRRGDLASLQRVKAALDKLKAPYYPVIGNHDDRATWRRVFGPQRLNYTFSHGGWRFLAVDTSSGRLDGAAMAWLARELRSDAAAPTVLLTHYPVAVPDAFIALARRYYGVSLLLGNAVDVLKLLAGAPNVRAVLAGHCHIPVETSVRGISHIVTPCLIGPAHLFRVLELRGDQLRSELRSIPSPAPVRPP
ncbi:MAG TPA: metallophosphoesterase [Planctomycetota bacterium]|nr:metallophosphoesterase [Planctomycetota bacterium]